MRSLASNLGLLERSAMMRSGQFSWILFLISGESWIVATPVADAKCLRSIVLIAYTISASNIPVWDADSEHVLAVRPCDICFHTILLNICF